MYFRGMFHHLRGSGPLLVVLGGGYANADTLGPLAGHLATDHTVLTHDRRGQSRSPGAGPVSVGGHADDLAEMLASVADGPAAVYGCSIGALIGLELTARHPELVHTLVAYEPPSPSLLPEPWRTRANADILGAEQAFRDAGAWAGLGRFGEFAAVDPADREDDVELEDPHPRMADLEFFLGEEVPVTRAHELDLDALAKAPARIVPVSGEKSADLWLRRCTTELAARLDVPWHEVPGAHNGDMFRPRAFAARLRELLG